MQWTTGIRRVFWQFSTLRQNSVFKHSAHPAQLPLTQAVGRLALNEWNIKMAKRIILIDDDKQVTPFYIQAFEFSQYEIRHFLSVNSITDIISSKEPETDLFIIDVMLPSGNYNLTKTENGLLTGLYVALDIRKTFPDIPIILFSASPLPPVTMRARSLARKLSKCSYVSKPEYPPDKLVEYVDYYFKKGKFKDGTLRKLFDSLILEPNLNGIGVDLKKLTSK